MKLSNFIAVASDATYFVPLRKGGKEKINKNNYLLSSHITFKKTLFHHHYSFLDFVLYFIDSENCAGPTCLNDFSIYSGGTYRRGHKLPGKSLSSNKLQPWDYILSYL